MKKIIITLSILALIASSCNQARKQQTKTANNEIVVEQTSEIIVEQNNDSNIDSVEIQNTNNNQLFDIQEIDSVTYFAQKEKANIQKVELEKVTDFEQAKKMLKGRIIWGEYNEENGKLQENEQSEMLYKILFHSGKTYLTDDYFYFRAYYPTENILLLEGGHTIDISFNLTTGEETENVGNPEYIVFSPSKQYRLNGHFGGQECSMYFIQEKIDGQYHKILQLSSGYEKTEVEKIIDIWLLCHISDAFWQNDITLNFITVVPDESGREEIKLYYQLTLK